VTISGGVSESSRHVTYFVKIKPQLGKSCGHSSLMQCCSHVEMWILEF